MIIKFQIINTTRKEKQIMPQFCRFLIDKIYEELNTPLNRRKIQLRINYMYKTKWITWSSKKYTDVQTIMDNIYKSFKYNKLRNNVWVIDIDNVMVLKGTLTPISRIVRFINSGDININGTGMFSKIENKYRSTELVVLWNLFTLDNLQEISEAKIITK